jgi:predicted regulator of Ras-like GTPase activity (Roadblock/LC7/MglB family)
LIDHQADSGLDAESIAAHVPSILSHADELAAAAGQGHLMTAVHEHAGGTAVIAAMSTEAVLLVLLRPTADVGSLLFDLRRHRANIAALV